MARKRDLPEHKIRQTITSLPGVQSCKIEMGPDGEIEAIHVVSSTKRPAKQIVRDIESVLYADYDLKLNHRKVSVARIEPPAERKPGRGQRPRLISLKLSTSGGRGEAEVVLERGDSQTTGQASGVTTGGGTLRLICMATFRAAEKLIGEEAEFQLLDVVRITTGERSAVVVLADYLSGREVRNLAGCVQFEDDQQEAAVLACLDACNRIMEMAPGVEHTEYEVIPFTED